LKERQKDSKKKHKARKSFIFIVNVYLNGEFIEVPSIIKGGVDFV